MVSRIKYSQSSTYTWLHQRRWPCCLDEIYCGLLIQDCEIWSRKHLPKLRGDTSMAQRIDDIISPFYRNGVNNMQYLLSCALHGQQCTHRSFTLTCLGYALNLAIFGSDRWLPPQHLGWNWDPPQHWVDHQWREGYTEGHTATAWTTVYLEEM